jgi:outer membrane lipoprotein-sorting protein
MLRRLVGVLALVTLAAATVPAAATGESGDAHRVIEKMIERNPSLDSYRARVHVDVKMLSFPFLSPQLDGTSYYHRPDTYEVVFDRMPSYAKSFQRLFDDIGDPAAWEKDQNISLDGTGAIDGRAALVLRLTKKIHSSILDHTLAYVDSSTYELLQMEWYYTSGGKITMSQQFREQGGYSVLATQHADIDIPHVRAVADASYDSYQTNVADLPSTSDKP